ncbi:MAG: glycosyltransferase [Cellulosilyticaceae bacterium]
MNKKIVIGMLFNINPPWPRNPYQEARLTREWIAYRLDIFMKYTCNSLRHQTNQDFTALLAYDPVTEPIIKDILSQYPPLPDNIKFVPDIYREVRQYAHEYDMIYSVRIDSDNMFHPNYIEKLQAWEPEPQTQVIIAQHGYVYDINTGAMGKFYHESPSFFAFLIKGEDYYQHPTYPTENGHMGVIKLRHELMEGDNFMVIVHEQNVSNRFAPYIYQSIVEDPIQKRQILDSFYI